MTIKEQSGKIRSGPGLFKADLVRRVQRIQERNPAVRAFLRSYFSVEIAEQLGERIAADKQALPLFGSFFAVKDNIAVKGQPLSAGLRPPLIKTENEHADVVTAFIKLGATLLGSANMDELAAGISGENSYYGNVKNPLYPDRIAGGSSGGSAAAVADGWVDFAIGTDFGGSIRAPAAACAICGLKPAPQLLPAKGALLFDPLCDLPGLLAPELADLETLLEALPAGKTEAPGNSSYEIILPCATELALAAPEVRLIFAETINKLRGSFSIFENDAEIGFQRASAMRKTLAIKSISLEIQKRGVPNAVLPENIQAILALYSPRLEHESEILLNSISEFREQAQKVFGNSTFILAPTLSNVVPGWKDLKSPQRRTAALDLALFLPYANITTLPAVSFPIAQQGEELPFSLQLIGGKERELLKLARQIRQAL